MGELPEEQAARDLGGAVDFLLGHEAVTGAKVGAVGFCMGGGFVLLLANQQGDRIGAAVPFYGVGPAAQQADFSGLPPPCRVTTASRTRSTRSSRPGRSRSRSCSAEAAGPVEFHYYPAAHAFHNDANKLGTYDAEYATLAWQRTVQFLHAQLG